MTTRIIKSLTAFIIVTSVMAATTLNLAIANDNPINTTNDSTVKITQNNKNVKYLGSYSITSNSINHFAQEYLVKNLNITASDKDYNAELDLLTNSLKKSEILRENLLGELIYTLNDKKLIIQDIAGGESFVMDYEIKNNILFAKVYNFSEELAIGQFVDNGKFLIINSPDKQNSIFLEHKLS